MIAGFSINYLLGMGIWIGFLFAAIIHLLKKRQAYRQAKKNLLRLNLMLALVLVLDFMTFAEVAFAVLYVKTDAINMTNSSKRWFDLYVENQRNEFGARDTEEFTRSLPDGQRRICFIGDSFTVGHGIKNIDDRFSNLVEKKLEVQNPGNYKVVNLADPGLDISQIESRFRGILQARFPGTLQEGYQIDHLVYVICLNDIEGYNQEALQGAGKMKNAAPKNFILTKTYLYNWLYFRYLQYTRKELNDYFPELAKTYNSFAWDGFSRKLSQIADTCKQKNIKFNVVIFPFLHDLTSESIFLPAHKKIVQYCEKHQISVFDLEPVMKEHAGENLIVNRFDAHPNEKAHQYAANAIFDAIFRIKESKEKSKSSVKEDSK